MTREPFVKKKIRLCGFLQVNTALALLPNLPIDPVNPLEIIIREEEKIRKPDQNALMWVGPLADIAEQGWVNGRKFSAQVWHHYFKEKFLPEEYEDGITKDGYKKWEYAPDGGRVLVGSTTELTKRGFAHYLTAIEAEGANIGVQYRAKPYSNGRSR